MNVNKRPESAIHHTTTIDVAKNIQTTVARAGQKRTFNEFCGVSKDVKIAAPRSIIPQGGFGRPTLHDQSLPCLKAGDIQNLVSQGDFRIFAEKESVFDAIGDRQSSSKLVAPAYGLPKKLVENFAGLGIKSIYPWQSECLLRSGALMGQNNLVYTAPTGGGKSLVADVLMLKKVIENPKEKALLVLPYVALVQEKLRWIRKVVSGITKNVAPVMPGGQRPDLFRNRGDENSVRVVGFFGGSKSKATWADMDIAVCTIEKANAIINASIEDGSAGKLGVVVMDELHMIDDEHRGYILELMATKLLSIGDEIQLIGMSATLNNASLLARWLNNAKFYISKYRPVAVEEHLVFDNSIYPASSAKAFFKTAAQLNTQSLGPTQSKANLAPVKIIQPSPNKELSNPLINSVVALANETARSGYGALVFCSSRLGCERDAVLISQALPRPDEIDPFIMEKRIDLLNDLRNSTTGLDSTLEKTVSVGVAFHHAGLTTEERDLIADAYDNGVLKVIVATCSLAAGINLPARRVILHGARMGPELVGPAMLDLEAVAELMEAEIPSVESCLLPEKRGIKRALLEVIATRLATSDEAIEDYVKKTLLYHSMVQEKLSSMVETTMQDLEASGLVSRGPYSEYAATLMGQAIVSSGLSPEDGIFVHQQLRKALQAFVLDCELHVLYAFTPVQTTATSVNWQIFRKEVERLDESNMRVLEFVGLNPSIINKMAQGGKMKESTPEEVETIRIYHRFYVALQLRDLCNELPIYAVAKKYDIPRGNVQSLAQTCQGFASGMIKFCERMEWGALAAVLDHFSDRLKAGAKSDLLALAKVTFIKSRTARVFYDNGFKTVALLAAADVKDIVPVLLQAQPKKVKVQGYDENKFLEKIMLKAKAISDSANREWEKQMAAELDASDEY